MLSKSIEMEKLCLDCGETLRGRSDKKFCDDQCRSNFNNRMKAGQQCCIRPVNNILRKNHSVLSKICTGEKIRIKKEVLLLNGFNPDYHTHLHQTQSGNTYYFCYDYGVLKLDGDVFLVVKRGA
jgi:hypothetical protein